MRKIKFVAVICLCAITLFGCKKDKKVKDPEGTVELNMRNNSNGNTQLEFFLPNGQKLISLHIDDGNNFCYGWGSDAYYYHGNISLAKVDANCLGNITTIPTSGWSKAVAVEPGNAYVVRVECDASEGSIYNGYVFYCRIYVTSWTKSAINNGIIGAEVKYQYPMPL